MLKKTVATVLTSVSEVTCPHCNKQTKIASKNPKKIICKHCKNEITDEQK